MKTLSAVVFASLILGAAYATACSSSGTPSDSNPGGSSSGGSETLPDGAVVQGGSSGGGSGSSSGGGSGGSSSSSSSGGSSSGSAPATSQCTDLATAVCAQLLKCDTSDGNQSFGNEMSKCVARMVFSCPSTTEPGTSNTTQSTEACATAVSGLSSCSAFLTYVAANNGFFCPTPPGTLADGTTCLDDSQCKGGYCGEGADGGTAACGACAEKPPATDCQENSNCPSGQVCNANESCVTPGGVGATCDDSDPFAATQPCQQLMYCQFAATADGGTAATGTCVALGTTGQPCNGEDDANDCVDGDVCGDSNACVALKYAALGAACDGYTVVCQDGNCSLPDTEDASASGTCVALAADGAACEDDEDCQFNAYCQGNICTTSAPSCGN